MSLSMPGAEPTIRRAVLSVRGLALAGMLGAATIGGVAAQEATPDAMAAACTPPAATEMIAAEASPASDAAAETGAATPASEEVAAAAQAAAENFIACWNSGDLGATLGLVTPNLLQTSFGLADAMAAEAALPQLDLGPITLLEVGDVSTWDDGRVSIDVGYARGDHQHVDARWLLVDRDGQLLIDEEQLRLLDVEGDKAFISFSVADDATPLAFDQSTEVASPPVLMLTAINNGAERHVFYVVALPGGEGTPVPGDLLADGTVIGVVAVAPGDREELALVELPVGSYAVVDPAVEGSAATMAVIPPAE